MSPVWAPLASMAQSCAPTATVEPLQRSAAAAISVAGGQTSISARPAPPCLTASRIAAISARLARKPFIFQFPATSGFGRVVMAGRIAEAPQPAYCGRGRCPDPPFPLVPALTFGAESKNMLQGLRNASQNWLGRTLLAIVMGFIVVSFAIWGIGDIFRGFGTSKLAQVGSIDISSQEYRAAYQHELQRIQRQARRAVTNDEARAIGLDREVLSRLVSQAALDQKARQLGLAMAEEDLAKAILNDPSFKGPNGQFDRNRFANALRDFGYSERTFANERRQDYLRQEILQAVAGNLVVPEALLEAINRYRNETRSVDYVVLPPSAAGDLPAPSEDVLQKYYNEHKQTFRAPEYRRLVTLAVTPTTAVNPESI